MRVVCACDLRPILCCNLAEIVGGFAGSRGILVRDQDLAATQRSELAIRHEATFLVAS